MTESALQMQIAQVLRMQGYIFFSVPNEALGKINHRGDKNRMMRLKAMGLRSGVSDLVVVLKDRVIFMEVKTERGKQSESQFAFEKEVAALGHQYVVVKSVEEALKAVT